MGESRRDRVFLDLRTRIARIERRTDGRADAHATLPFGPTEIDRYLPQGGLPLGALHEVVDGSNPALISAGPALFAAGILARLDGPVLWCLKAHDLFAPGIADAGLHPDRVIYAETGSEAAILSVMEEGLRHRGLAGVVAETARLGLTSSRRLQLAAEESGVTALVIRRRRRTEPTEEANAAVTRWRVTVLPSAPISSPGLGRPRWHLELLRCRGAEPAEWIVEGCDAQGRLALVSDMADRQAAATAGRAASSG